MTTSYRQSHTLQIPRKSKVVIHVMKILWFLLSKYMIDFIIGKGHSQVHLTFYWYTEVLITKI